MKKLLLLSAMSLALVACERQVDKTAGQPEAVPEKPATEQTIIDNNATTVPDNNPVTKTPVEATTVEDMK